MNVFSQLLGERPKLSAGKGRVVALVGMTPERRPWSKAGFQPGDRVGQWTLLEYVPGMKTRDSRKNPKWRCRCTCGEVRDVATPNLRSLRSTSCGHDVRGKRRPADAPVNPWDLTRREAEVMEALVAYGDYDTAANKMGVSNSTMHTYLARAKKRMEEPRTITAILLWDRFKREGRVT